MTKTLLINLLFLLKYNNLTFYVLIILEIFSFCNNANQKM